MTYSPLPPPPGLPYTNVPPGADRSLANARRASLLLWILGGLSLFAALMILSTAAADPKQLADQLIASAPAEAQKQLAQMNLPKFVRIFVAVVGGLTLGVGLSLVFSAFFVRKGRIGATVFAMIVCGLCTIWWLFNVLTGVIHLAGGAVIGAVEIVFAGCFALAFGLCVLWLIGSVRAIGAASRHAAMSLGQIQYPPGYTTGYGVQTSMPLPPPPTTGSGN